MKKLFTTVLPVLLLVLGPAQWAAADLELVTGKHWTDASVEQKRAYLIGIGNVLEIEEAMAGDAYEDKRGRSIVPVMLEGLSGTGIGNLVTKLDTYYENHSDQIKRPVIEVLYIEMALPNLKK